MITNVTEELFRFVVIRAPQPTADDGVIFIKIDEERKQELRRGMDPLPVDATASKALKTLRAKLSETLQNSTLPESNFAEPKSQFEAISEQIFVALQNPKADMGLAEHCEDLRTLAFLQLDEKQQASVLSDQESLLRFFRTPIQCDFSEHKEHSASADQKFIKDQRKKKKDAYEAQKKDFIASAQSVSSMREVAGELSAVPGSALKTSQQETKRKSIKTSSGLIARLGNWLGTSGGDGFVAPQTEDQSFVEGPFLSERGAKSLSSNTQKVLKELKLDPVSTSLPNLQKTITRAEVQSVKSAIGAAEENRRTVMVNAMGNMNSRTKTLRGWPSSGVSSFDHVVWDIHDWEVIFPWEDSGPTEPSPLPFPSPLKESGLGQLLVTRQTLIGYAKGEVGHIENALEGEFREKVHRHKHVSEEFEFFESESETSEAHSLETTDRYELSTETSSVLDEKKKVDGSLELTGSYGMSVKFKANTSAEWSQSKQESQKTASSFAHDVVERAEKKVSEKVRIQRSRKIIDEIEVTNTHRIDNSEGETDNVSGIYQWVDKIYEAQIWDYGLRTLYDLIVPEPAAFMIAAGQEAEQSSSELPDEPAPFTLEPQQLTRGNYDHYVAKYNAIDVDAPPSEWEWGSAAFGYGQKKDWKELRKVETKDVQVPTGYEAVHYWMRSNATGDEETSLVVIVGSKANWTDWGTSQRLEQALPEITGAVPVAIRVFRASAYAVNVVISCRCRQENFENWQLDTHEKIEAAYQTQLAEFREAQARQILQDDSAFIGINGRNPATNKRMMHDEVKRAAITMIANRNVDFGAVLEMNNGLSLIDVAASRIGEPEIRFLEQAFEWEQMNYLMYPYVWGRRLPHWKRSVLYEDTDPDFAQFVRAGAARVQLAVRPGFESAVSYYLKTGVPWEGGPMPNIGDNTYVTFAQEHAGQLGRPGEEVPFGEPWEVRVPTSLVKLRKDNELPEWESLNGSWVLKPDLVNDS
ncbi:MAG: hypothetical protein AAGL90_03150 [Pseudomonadota bacterium]